MANISVRIRNKYELFWKWIYSLMHRWKYFKWLFIISVCAYPILILGYCYGFAIAFLFYFVKGIGIEYLRGFIFGMVVGSLFLFFVLKILHRVFWKREYEDLPSINLSTLNQFSIK